MASARDFDGTALSAAHIGVELADMYGAMKDNSPTLAKGTALMQVVDGTPDLSGNVEITGNLSVAQGVGFFGATPGSQLADMGALTDSTGGATPDGTVAPVGATNSGDESGAINANFRELLTKVNTIRDALRGLGLMA